MSQAGCRARAVMGGIALLVTSAAAAAPVRLSIQAAILPWKGVGEPDNLAVGEMHQAFLERHPGVVIEAQEPVALPGPQAGAAQIMSLAGEAGPDLLAIPFKDLGTYVAAGLIQPIDDLLQEWPERGRWPQPLTDGLKLAGHDWMLPFDVQLTVLAASAAAAGTVPRDWEALIAAARAAAKPGRPGLGQLKGAALGELWHAYARQAAGGEIARVEGDGVTADLEGASAVRAAELLARTGAELRKDGGPGVALYDDAGALAADLAAGKLAFGPSDSWTLQTLAAKTNAAAVVCGPLPGAFAPEPVSIGNGMGTVMPAGLRDPARRALAWEYHTTAMKTNAAVERRWLELAAARGAPLALTLAAKYPDHAAAAAWPASWRAAFAAAWPRAAPDPPHPEFELLCALVGDELARAVAGDIAPAEALKRAGTRFEETVHERSRRTSPGWRLAGVAGLALLAALLAAALVRLWRTLRAEWRAVRASPQSRIPRARLAEALVLFAPAAAAAAVFGAAPLAGGVRMSLMTEVLRDGGRFAGLGNYLDAVVARRVHLAAGRTLEYLALSFVLCLVLPLLLAVAVTAVPRGRDLLRTTLLLPSLVGAAVVAVVWRQALTANGAMNQTLGLLGVAPHDWLGSPRLALLSVVLSQAWATMGATQLLFLAGLASVPEELYEDTTMLGGNLWHRFRHAAWPFLAPVAGVTVVGWLLGTVRTAEPVFLLTGGGPEGASHVLGLEIFNQAYVFARFGYAMAEVWLLVAAVMLVAVVRVRAIRTGDVREQF